MNHNKALPQRKKKHVTYHQTNKCHALLKSSKGALLVQNRSRQFEMLLVSEFPDWLFSYCFQNKGKGFRNCKVRIFTRFR